MYLDHIDGIQLYASASSDPQRIARRLPLTLGTKQDIVMILTLRCRNCHAQVERSTTICAMLYHTAREFVLSERSR